MDEISNSTSDAFKSRPQIKGMANTTNSHDGEQTLQRYNSSEGSMASEKIKLLDITRGKPIKLTVRVVVPAKDHPNFNFVGKLLGPKGNSMKRLQEETMCKMAVLGRGSIRDMKKEEELRASGDPRYAHLAHDLHVEISTFAPPTEAHARIAYALAEVRSFLIPDNNDAIRQQQMLEMKAMKSQNVTESLQKAERTSLKNVLNVHNNYHLPITRDIPVQLQGLLTALPKNHHHQIVAIPSPSGQISRNILKNDENTITTTTSSTNSIETFPPHPSGYAIHYHVESSENGCQQSDTRSASMAGRELPPSESIYSVKGDATLRTPTVAYIHPTLQVVKTVNDAAGFVRKHPYVTLPYANMHPTKRAVMTLLARAKSSRALLYRSKLQKAENPSEKLF